MVLVIKSAVTTMALRKPLTKITPGEESYVDTQKRILSDFLERLNSDGTIPSITTSCSY